MDMLVNLYRLPEDKPIDDVEIVRALPPDIHHILAFVREQFSESWVSECSVALYTQPCTCFIAKKDSTCIGFACYDATARGMFGPLGVAKEMRGSGVGRALLLACLHGMREAGYGYAVIGWCDEAAPFYEHAVGAVRIPNSEPENTAYGRMIMFS